MVDISKRVDNRHLCLSDTCRHDLIIDDGDRRCSFVTKPLKFELSVAVGLGVRRGSLNLFPRDRIADKDLFGPI
jgi:hypothetical protein